ncbi:hypothetical protein BHM03_00056404 [Ensete ventricosum]|nr:hypothetical protein BHM03_00056404 [Ensete ventricosum]
MVIPKVPMGNRTSTVSRKNRTIVTFEQSRTRSRLMSKATREVEFRLVFRSPSRKFKILAIPNVLAHGKSYEQGFVKKCNVHRLCAMSRAKSSFDRVFMHHLRKSKYRPFETRVLIGFSCTISEIQNTSHSNRISPWEVVRAWFREKFYGHKLCTKSSFDRFVVHRLENSKYWPLPKY